jgi:hypothetical protein
MCTVTFIPVKDKIFITSNRDEKIGRSPALSSAVYNLQTGNVLFPKDTDAGGTWFAVHENGNAIVFLNGGWISHQTNPPYRKSRGLILIDLIDSEMPFHSFLVVCLHNIEPFTAIVRDDGELFECRWDGIEKYYCQLDKNLPHIWSSVTLYEEQVIEMRREWFIQWLQKNPDPSQEDILDFHRFSGTGDEQNDLLMNRDGNVFTVSISSAEITGAGVLFKYVDTLQDQTSVQELPFTKTSVEKK